MDRTGIPYGHLVALHDTGRLTKKGECVWAARCTVIRNGKECGRIKETPRLGQSNGPKSCGCLAVPMREVTGEVFAGWKAVRRTDRKNAHRDYWLLECPTCCSRITRNIVVGRYKLVPCRTCHPAQPRRRPPQKVTTKDYPCLRSQLALLWLKLKPRLDAGEVVEILVGRRYSAFVDASDAPLLLPYAWQVSPSENGKTFYVRATVGRQRYVHAPSDSRPDRSADHHRP